MCSSVILQGVEVGCSWAMGAAGSGEAGSPGAGAAVLQCPQLPPTPWFSHFWGLRAEVIGNGLCWGYPSSSGCICAYIYIYICVCSCISHAEHPTSIPMGP